MFSGLQKKWGVSASQVILILLCFAIAGSITGYLGRRIISLMAIDSTILWTLMYIIIITFIWPIAVLLVSVPFMQFPFFKNYIARVFKKIFAREKKLFALNAGGVTISIPQNQIIPTTGQKTGEGSSSPVRMAIFASGAGSNAKKIIEYFRSHSSVSIALVVCNKPGAGVLQIAETEHIPILQIEKEQFFRGNAYVNELKERGIDFIVLAGFLWKIPSSLIKAYQGRIINIHPALLPKYGGKGMYGQYVHEAVLNAKEKESGITIHFVDEIFDHGEIIFQARCPIEADDTPQSLAEKIHQLEHQHYPRVIESILLEKMK